MKTAFRIIASIESAATAADFVKRPPRSRDEKGDYFTISGFTLSTDGGLPDDIAHGDRLMRESLSVEIELAFTEEVPTARDEALTSFISALNQGARLAINERLADNYAIVSIAVENSAGAAADKRVRVGIAMNFGMRI